jgi:uncharacterized membrane protein YczE
MKRFIIRFLDLLLGLFLFALGIVLTINANIGYAPWEVFHVGLSLTTGISIGFATIVTGLVILAIVAAFGEKIGLGTILNVVIIGVFIDLILIVNVLPMSTNLASGVIMLISGLLFISVGSYFYIKSAFGTGPRDSLMVLLKRKTNLPVGVCRSAVELTATIVGWLLGGMVGIGTVISVIAIGFCIQITFTILKFDVTTVKHESLKQTFNFFAKTKT